MERNIFAVCDLETEYALNFLDYLSEKKTIPFEIRAFTMVEHLLEYGKQHPIELLLISERAMCPEVEELSVGRLILLSDGGRRREEQGYPCVYKYQSSDQVIREVMGCYGEGSEQVPSISRKKSSCQFLGVYSPLGRCGKTSLALAMGQILSERQQVLYLNLEEYSGGNAFLRGSQNGSLTELLYYLRQGKGAFSIQMNALIQTVNRMDYLSPVQNPEDIRAVPWEIWERLLKEIERNTAYDTVVLDIGSEIDGLFYLLDRCDALYVPVLSDPSSRWKIAQFEGLLATWKEGQLQQKISRVCVPSPPNHFSELSGNSYVEAIAWGEVGTYARAVLKKRKGGSA